MGSENPGFLVYPRTLWLYPIFRHKAILSDQIRSDILLLYHIIADYKYDRYPAKSPLKYVLKWSVEIHPQCSF